MSFLRVQMFLLVMMAGLLSACASVQSEPRDVEQIAVIKPEPRRQAVVSKHEDPPAQTYKRHQKPKLAKTDAAQAAPRPAPITTRQTGFKHALVISDIHQNAGEITIQWNRLASAEVAAYRVYRLQHGVEDGYQSLALLKRNRYRDLTSISAARLSYRISAVDAQGREVTRSAARSPVSFSKGRMTRAVSELMLRTDRHQHPLLNWQPYGGKDLRGYLVFRAAHKRNDWQTISPLLKQNHFTDETAKPGKGYRYRVRALLTRGRYSRFSGMVQWPNQLR